MKKPFIIPTWIIITFAIIAAIADLFGKHYGATGWMLGSIWAMTWNIHQRSEIQKPI